MTAVSMLLLTYVALVAKGSASPAAQPIEIRVESSWSGLGVILDRPTGTPAQASPTGFTVACAVEECPQAVRRLLSLLESPAKSHLELKDFDALVSWLQSADPDELRGESGYLVLANRSPRVRAAFDAVRADTTTVQEALADYFDAKHFWTDDYPSVSVAMTLADGRHVFMSSGSQKAFMIPWELRQGDSKQIWYEPEIGRALAALAPPGFPETGRLSGASLKPWLVSKVYELAARKAEKP